MHQGAGSAAQDAGLGGVVQNEQACGSTTRRCELFEDTAAIKDRTQEGELREKQVTNSEGYFLFDRSSLSLGERYVLKVSHPMYMTERKAVDLKKVGTSIYVKIKTGTGDLRHRPDGRRPADRGGDGHGLRHEPGRPRSERLGRELS